MAKKKPAAPPKPATATAPTTMPVSAVKHTKATRTNIPTRELGDMVADDEAKPKVVRYPRDESLDPQLVWKGKDEQDAKPLEIPAPPIYIQEKVHPQALIEDIRAAGALASDKNLFSDFNGLEPKGVELGFYSYDRHWTNRLILGDSLQVMASLAEKEKLRGKVQMIYFDPPYGIKFGSNWQVSTRKRDVKDAKAEDVTRQPEQIKAFRDTWELGIHSYLTYLRDRLIAARDLLADSGSVIVQIGDENVHLVRSVMDEVFGSENFLTLVTVVKTSAQEDLKLPNVCDYLLWYGKDREQTKYRQTWVMKSRQDAGASDYNMVRLLDGTGRRMTSDEIDDPETLPPNSRVYTQDNIVSQRPPGDFPVTFEGTTYRPITGYWKTGVEGMAKLVQAKRIEKRGSMLRYVRYVDDFPVRPIANFWNDTRFSSRVEDKTYVVQTAAKVIERCLLLTTDPGDLVLDPSCGSDGEACVERSMEPP